MPSQPSPSTSAAPVSPEMILHAFSTLGISGKNTSSSSMWYFNSGASNHMTVSPSNLSNVQSYDGKLQVHTADGEKLSFTTIGDVPQSLPLHDVFLTPSVSTNLVSVGQLVDNHCEVSFSSAGCVV